MALGKIVKALRTARGWTLKDLSKRSGVPVGTIGAIEVRDSVRSEYAAKLAHGLGVSIDELLSGDQSGATPPNYKQNQTLSPIDKAQAAMNNVADSLQILAQYINASPSKGSDALAGTLVSLSKDPCNPIYIDMLGKMLQTPSRPGVESTDFHPGVPSLFTKTTS